MAIEDFKNYIDDEDYEFSYGTMDFLSTKMNSHKHVISEEVLREYAPSVLGKWVIGEEVDGDMSTHTSNQTIQGRIPENQEVKFRRGEDGSLIASVDIVLSKLYAKAHNILRKDNFRNVSIEALFGFTEETENLITGIDEKIVEGFNITAVTILGKAVNGSVPNANVRLTQMSEDNIKDIEMQYVQYAETKKDLKDDDKMSIILNKLEEIKSKLESHKEESMAENTKEEVVVEAEVEVVEELAQVAEEETEMACGDATEEKLADVEDNVEDEDAEKMADLEAKLSDAEVKMASLESELKELREFKLSALNTQRDSVVYATLSQIKELVDTDSYSKFEESGKVCQFENINGWKNEVLASVANLALAKMSELTSKEDGILDMGTVGVYSKETRKTSIYD
jgi:hypothetical protein